MIGFRNRLYSMYLKMFVRKKDAQETLLTLLSGPKNVLWQTQERVEELGVSLHHTLGLLGEGSLHTGRKIVQ